MSFKPYTIFLAFAVLLSLGPSLCAQASSDAMGGTVFDPDGRAVPRALVSLVGEGGTTVAQTLTDDAGRFEFEPRLGSYRVLVTLEGFVPEESPVAPDDPVRIVLKLSPVHEEVVVTATRTSAPTAQLGATTTVFSREEIVSRNAVTLSDLLRSMPGASLVRNGGHGTLTSLFVRGAESNHNKILLDGVPLNGPGGELFLSNLTLASIERVEVVRGPQSALFGSDAIGDVVQLFTRRSSAETPTPAFNLSFEGGNRSTWQGRGGISGVANPATEGTGRFDYTSEWTRFFSDNRVPNNTFSNTSVSTNLGLGLAEATTLRAVLRSEKGIVGTPDATAFEAPDLTSRARSWLGTGVVTVTDRRSERWEQRLTYGFNENRQVSQDLVADKLFDFLFDSLDVQKRHHASYQSDIRFGSIGRSAGHHQVTYVAEWEGQRGLFGDRLDPANVASASRDNFGWVVQHQALWRRFSLSTGVRLENNDSFGFAAAPRLSAAYFVRQTGGPMGSTKLKFNFGLGIKEPTFVESFSRNPFFLGNPDLEEERSRSIEAGVEQRLMHDRVKVEINLFDTDIRNLIEFEIVDFNTFEGSFFNVRRADARGGEAIVEFAPLAGLRASGTYTFLDTRSSATQRPLLRRPKHSGTVGVGWYWKRLNVSSTAFFVGQRQDFDPRTFGTSSNAGYVRWDLAGTFRASHGLTYFVVVDNLSDEEYMEALGFPALERMYRAGASVEF